MKSIEDAFGETTQILFGKQLTPITEYESWLMKRLPTGEVCKSVVDGAELYRPKYSVFTEIPLDKVAGLKSLPVLSKKQMTLSGNETLQGIRQKMGDIATCIIEFVEGENEDVADSTIYFGLYHAYKTVDCVHSKYLACSFWSGHCEWGFGISRCFACNFSVHCYNSKYVNRSFEVDFSKNCSDVMFCHNCDDVRDSLFCFNTKSKRYAIANVEVGKERYQEARAMLIKRILESLEKRRTFETDIYNIGGRCPGK